RSRAPMAVRDRRGVPGRPTPLRRSVRGGGRLLAPEQVQLAALAPCLAPRPRPLLGLGRRRLGQGDANGIAPAVDRRISRTVGGHHVRATWRMPRAIRDGPMQGVAGGGRVHLVAETASVVM